MPFRRTTSSVVVSAIAVTAVACSAQEAPRDEPPSEHTSTESVVGHVHGLGVDPGDDTLYVASHFGVFRVEDGEPDRVADRWQDTMGFAIVGPGHFLASGHPDLREELPAHLGLIESRDGAQTWSPVALEGEADFHAIEALPDRVYAYESQSMQLLVSRDRKLWKPMGRRPLLDLAADPSDPSVLYATTPEGRLLVSSNGSGLVPVPNAPRTDYIDWETEGRLVAVTRSGDLMVSGDGRSGWTKTGTVSGNAEAFDATPGRWHVATEEGVYESSDEGRTWVPVLRPSG